MFAIIFSVLLLFPGITWNSGSIVTSDNQVITGEMAPDFHLNVLMVKSEERSYVLYPSQIRSFRFYDDSMNLNRKFEKIESEGKEVFIEIVLDGQIRMIRKLKKINSPVSADPKQDLYQQQIADFDFYILFENELFELREFNQILGARFGSKVKFLNEPDLLKKLISRICDLNDTPSTTFISKK